MGGGSQSKDDMTKIFFENHLMLDNKIRIQGKSVMMKWFSQVSVKLTLNNHVLSLSCASRTLNVVGIISSNWIWLLLAFHHSWLAGMLFNSNVLTIEEFIKPIIDGIVWWYATLSSCHHYQLFSSSKALCWHVRVSYASIVLQSMNSSLSLCISRGV